MEVSTCFSGAPCRVSWQRKKKSSCQCSVLSPLSVVFALFFIFKLARWEARSSSLVLQWQEPTSQNVTIRHQCRQCCDAETDLVWLCRCCKSHCTWGGQPQRSQRSRSLLFAWEVFASGVHHFCQYDRAFKEAGSLAWRFPFDLLVCLFLIQAFNDQGCPWLAWLALELTPSQAIRSVAPSCNPSFRGCHCL